MIKTVNQVHLEGILYQHNLKLKVTGKDSKNPNTEYITGTIDIATDDACVNIVPVHFTYVTATTSSKKPNATFTALRNIIDKVYGTVMADGIDRAIRVRIDTSVGLNEFYSDRNGQDELVSVKRNEGGFLHVISASEVNPDDKVRNSFKCDMVITQFLRKEADEERDLPERGTIKGCIFNFRNEMLPVEFSVLDADALNYYESLDISSSNPTFTRVWGHQVSETVITKKVTESAFGEPSVTETRSSRKDYVITGSQKSPYDWDDEGSLTAQEFKEIIARREVYLATLKQQRDEFKNKQNNNITPANGGFNF